MKAWVGAVHCAIKKVDNFLGICLIKKNILFSFL